MRASYAFPSAGDADSFLDPKDLHQYIVRTIVIALERRLNLLPPSEQSWPCPHLVRGVVLSGLEYPDLIRICHLHSNKSHRIDKLLRCRNRQR